MKKTRLSSKDLNKELGLYKISFGKKDILELWEDTEKKQKLVIANSQPSFFYYENKAVPTLKFILANPEVLKKITVDMGAIRFVINGADIMRPGIKDIEAGIKKDEFIVIIDETHCKPLAVGIALLNSEEMKSATAGKVIKNIHYVGDELWKFTLS